MAGPNLFKELQDALTKFQQFLDKNNAAIKAAVQAIKVLVPQISTLIATLIDLLGKLKAEIIKLNPGAVGQGLTTITEFTTNIKTVLEAAKALLPDETAKIQEVIDAASVVTSLPSLTDLKDTLTKLIDDIIGRLGELKA